MLPSSHGHEPLARIDKTKGKGKGSHKLSGQVAIHPFHAGRGDSEGLPMLMIGVEEKRETKGPRRRGVRE